MKNIIIMILCCVLLTACSANEKIKGEMDIRGSIVEMDQAENRLLVEDDQIGSIWVTLPENDDIDRFESGQEVAIWVAGGIDTSSPAFAEAAAIEFIDSK